MPWVFLKQQMNRLLSWKPTVREIFSTKIPEDSRIVLGFSLRAGSLFALSGMNGYLMCMKLRRLKEKDITDIRRLYELSFPERERISLNHLLHDPSETFVIEEKDQFLGFVSMLCVNDLCHITYFAIEPAQRGRGYGTAVLKLLETQKEGSRIFVDVEKPALSLSDNARRVRRIAFYEAAGYVSCDIHYLWSSEEYTILSWPGPLTKKEFISFWKQIDPFREIHYHD